MDIVFNNKTVVENQQIITNCFISLRSTKKGRPLFCARFFSTTGSSVLAKYSYLSDGMKTGAFKADGSGFIYRGSLKYAVSRTSRCPTPTSAPGTTAPTSAAGSPQTPSPRSTTPPAHTPTAPETLSTLWIRMEGIQYMLFISGENQ